MIISYKLNNSVVISKDMADDYWMNTSGSFIYKLDTLAEKYNLTSKEITSAISSIHSYIDFGSCAACSQKNEEAVGNRTRALQVMENVYYHYFCDDCREKAKHYCKKMSDEEEKKIVWMKLCFKYKLWNKLDNYEMNFFKALYYLGSWNRIYHEMIKLNPTNNFKLLFKLDKMHLIYYDKCVVTGQIRVKITKDLQDLIQKKII